MSDSQLVRVDTHRVVMVLYGLCGSARSGLVFEPHPDDPAAVVAGFSGRNGGAGVVVIPDDPELRATLDWLAAEPKAEVHLRAVLAAVRACDSVAGGWALERALELLWGPRKRDQSRCRQLPAVKRILQLLAEATWRLDAPVSAPPPPTKGRRRDGDRDRKRASYGGTFTGCLLNVDTATRTATLNAELRRLLDAGPYDMRPVEVFRLPRPGHTNPRGTQPSRAHCCLMVQGVWDYARFRQQQALQRGGAVQAVHVEDLLGRWTSVDVDAVARRRLLPAFVDRLETELAAGGVTLAAPIERQRQPGRCELRLRISLDRRPRSPTHPNPAGNQNGRRQPGGDNRRPPAASTSTGTTTSTGPPPT